MKTFKQYVVLRETEEIDSDSDSSTNDSLHRAVDLAWKANRIKLMSTFRAIADQEDGSELRGILDELEKQGVSQMNQKRVSDEPQRHNKKDNEVMPPIADQNPGLDDFE